MSWQTILITGGTGYIWSHAAVAFAQAGHTVVLLDNLSNSSRQTLDGIEKILGYRPDFHCIDLRNQAALDTLFAQYTFDGVIHFAGLKAVGWSCEQAGLYFENNINGTINLLNTMERHKVKSLVFSSSCTVYGTPQYTPVDEQHPLGETTNPYGRTKALLEKILADYATFAWFTVVNLRYFNPIGAHPSGHIGEHIQGPPPNLLPYIFKVATGELPHINVFGTDYPTPDGSCIRDYIDINDLVDGHLKAWKYIKGHFCKDASHASRQEWSRTAINLGIGQGTSVLEIIKLVEQITKQPIPAIVAPRRAGDIAAIYANADLAQKLLWWKATTPVEESIRTGLLLFQKMVREKYNETTKQ